MFNAFKNLARATVIGALLAGSIAGTASAAPAIDWSFGAPTPNEAADPFYTPPTSIPDGQPGDVIRARVAPAGPPTARELAAAWQVMYLSTDPLGNRNVVTGTVLVPRGTDLTKVPVIGFAPGTTGPAFRCTVSRWIANGAFYEQAAINDMLRAGYAVAITDYEGYHENPTASYINAKAMSSAVLDSVRAATRLPEAKLAANPKVLLRGYSQGGGATMAAAQNASTYAPELNILGVAAGGVPADLVKVAIANEGRAGFGFVLNAWIGLDNAYPELKLDNYTNALGKSTLANMEANDCTLELLLNYAGKTSDVYTGDISPFSEDSWIERVVENQLGKVKINVPVFQYHGTKDQIVAFSQASAARTAWCKLGVNETWKTYPVDHITGVARGNADVMAFLADRVAGVPATSNCGT
ncbi:MAG: hypothetical protein PGN13_08690 [Patulibacter minatonensis]